MAHATFTMLRADVIDYPVSAYGMTPPASGPGLRSLCYSTAKTRQIDLTSYGSGTATPVGAAPGGGHAK